MISKTLLLFLSATALLFTNTLSQTPTPAAVSHCDTGFCLECQLHAETNQRVCTTCFNSDIEKISGLDVKGGKCKGRVPINYCAIMNYGPSEGSIKKKCFMCKSGAKISLTGMLCTGIRDAHCQKFVSGTCTLCSEGYVPSGEGDTCIITETRVDGCAGYAATEGEGGAVCGACKWNYVLNHTNPPTCTARTTSQASTKCSSVESLDVATGSCGFCNYEAGYFAVDIGIEPAAASRRRLQNGEVISIGAGGGEGENSLTSHSQKCVKDQDFNPDDPFAGGSANIKTWLMNSILVSIAFILLGVSN